MAIKQVHIMNELINIVYEIGIILAVLFGDTSDTEIINYFIFFPNCFFFSSEVIYAYLSHTPHA